MGTPPASSAPTTTTPALPADQVQSAVKTAALGASAVHVKGYDAGVALDLQLNKDSASGTLTKQGATIPVRLVNGVYYVQCTDNFLKMAGLSPNSPAQRVLRNKWVSSTSKFGANMTGAFKDTFSYDGFMQKFFNQVPDKKGAWSPTGSDTVDGVAVLGFKNNTDGWIVDVAAASPHYLIRGVGPAANAGTIDFTRWNQPVQITAPPTSEIYVGPGA
jgi:hypothetical protein